MLTSRSEAKTAYQLILEREDAHAANPVDSDRIATINQILVGTQTVKGLIDIILETPRDTFRYYLTRLEMTAEQRKKLKQTLREQVPEEDKMILRALSENGTFLPSRYRPLLENRIKGTPMTTEEITRILGYECSGWKTPD